MSPSPPGEAIHFRGESLSPESPRPLHYPEPSRIPVLENQIDPVFNDTATYQTASTPAEKPSLFNFSQPGLDATSNTNGEAYHTNAENGIGDEHGVASTHEIEGAFSKGSYPKSLALGDRGSDNQANPSTSHENAHSSNLDSLSPGESSLNSSFALLPPNPTLSIPLTAPSISPQDPPPNPIGPYSDTERPTLTLNDALTDAINLVARQTTADVSQSEESREYTGQMFSEGVNAQLGAPSPSTATAPPAGSITAATTTSPIEESTLQEAGNDKSLPIPAGLPPRPPPQDKPSMHPNYTASDDIRTYHQFQPPAPNISQSYVSQPSNTFRPGGNLPPPLPNSGAPGTTPSSTGLPSPLPSTFQQSLAPGVQQQIPPTPAYSQGDAPASPMEISERGDDETPWGPEVQRKYDEFLTEERVYVTEGLWDRFPNGSRLFIGNLPTEKVTKRDLFHVFHRYGKLAQISIKQAYGFVQFLDAAACQHALRQEQNMPVRGRKMHLEISKPQKNSRNAGQDGGRAGQGRRSPDRSRGGRGRGGPRNTGDHFSGQARFSDYRDEPRRRDDYRPGRSPSPRGLRGRDDYRKRERSPDDYDRRNRARSRSPPGRGGRLRSPSPRSRAPDLDSDFPFPRRAPRDVPDVQLVMSEELDRGFIYFVEKAFRDRNLRTDVLLLPPRVDYQAAVRRQIVEGVQAVAKLARDSYLSGKIPLLVFDLRSGTENVRYDEYSDLDVSQAAGLVIRAKETQASVPPVQYPPAQPYAIPQYPPTVPQQPQLPGPVPSGPNISSLISNLDASGLQRLLGALQQPATPLEHATVQAAPPPSGGTTDLAGLLSTVARQQQNLPQQYPPPQQQPALPANAFAALQANPALANNPALSALFSGKQPPQPPGGQMQPGQRRPDFSNPLAKWQ